MFRKRFVLALLLLLLTLSVAPIVHAQTELPPVDFQQILGKLGPRQGTELLFDILLYAIFILGIITSVLIPDKQLLPTLLMVAVLGMTVIVKVGIGTFFDQCGFAPLVLNAGIFALPLIVAGMVRARIGTPKAMAPAALTGLLGGVYFFMFWAVVQSKLCG